MKVLVVEHFRLPYQNAGSEVMMHRLAVALRDAGHRVVFATTDTPRAAPIERFDGMKCYNIGLDPEGIAHVMDDYKPDVVISHHQRAADATRIGHHKGIPSVFVMHNNFTHNRYSLSLGPDLTVFNSRWIADEWKQYTPNYMVVRPPVLQGQCDAPRGNKITLINLNEHKGGEIFYQLATMLPEYQFLGVIGAHGQQVIRRDLPNVEIQEHTVNMCQDVWAKTKILLMPSIYESYGMTGLEACCQGIPVLANSTPGLQESLGIAGWFIPRDDIQRYAEVIRLLMEHEDEYDAWSAGALQRSTELRTEEELAEFVARVEALVKEK